MSRDTAPANDSPARSWSGRAGFLGVVFAVAAGVIGWALFLAEPVSAHRSAAPSTVAALLAFLLLLAAAAILFIACLPDRAESSPVARPGAPAAAPSPAPPALPDAAAPSGPGPDGSQGPDAAAARTPAATPGRSLTVLGLGIGLAGLAVAAIAVLIAVLIPTRTESIMVQFTDLTGRVQLEYCPGLPGSFSGLAAHTDLTGADTILPVKVSAETCGNPEFTGGVWIYLNRTSITVADQP